MPGAITNITVGPGGGGDVTPTEVSPVVVYAPVTYSGGGGFGATVTSYSAGAYGSIEIARMNAAATRAGRYIADHVQVMTDMNDPAQKAVADKIIESIYTAIFNDSLNSTKTVGTDPSGNHYTGAEMLTLMDNMDFKIVAQASNPNNTAQASTTFASTSLSERGHVEIVGSMLVGADQANIDFTVAHEIAHALPAGHQMANYTAQAFFDNGGQQYTVLNPATGHYEATPQYYTAFDASQYKIMNESWANTVGKMISSFDGMGWYHDGGTNVPAYGYWHF